MNKIINQEEESMRVLIRIRPPENEINEINSLIIDETFKKISLLRDKNKGIAEFSFSNVLGINSTQYDLFQLCKDTINDVIEGINCCILAYGQTGSGKTYSMLGQGWEDISISESNEGGIIQNQNSFGIIPRCIAQLFDWIEKHSTEKSFDFSINCQYLQIYNEKIFDLLQDRKRQNPLQLRDSEHGSNSTVYVQGLSEYRVHCLDDVLSLLLNGMRNRAIRATEFNNESSRSHTILQLFIQLHGEDSAGYSTLTRSTLSFVDLAGSEKWRPSLSNPNTSLGSNTVTIMNSQQQQTEQQIREMTNINTSLHVLGNCVSALIESGRKHIPFRDSMLTRLLQDSLGGGKTTLIATIRSDESMRDETYSTLQFASRASKVKTILRPLSKVWANNSNNSNNSNDNLNLEQAKKEIAMLRARIQSLENQQNQIGNKDMNNSNNGNNNNTNSSGSFRKCSIPHNILNFSNSHEFNELLINENCTCCNNLERFLYFLMHELKLMKEISYQSNNHSSLNLSSSSNLRSHLENSDVDMNSTYGSTDERDNDEIENEYQNDNDNDNINDEDDYNFSNNNNSNSDPKTSPIGKKIQNGKTSKNSKKSSSSSSSLKSNQNLSQVSQIYGSSQLKSLGTGKKKVKKKSSSKNQNDKDQNSNEVIGISQSLSTSSISTPLSNGKKLEESFPHSTPAKESILNQRSLSANYIQQQQQQQQNNNSTILPALKSNSATTSPIESNLRDISGNNSINNNNQLRKYQPTKLLKSLRNENDLSSHLISTNSQTRELSSPVRQITTEYNTITKLDMNQISKTESIDNKGSLQNNLSSPYLSPIIQTNLSSSLSNSHSNYNLNSNLNGTTNSNINLNLNNNLTLPSQSQPQSQSLSFQSLNQSPNNFITSSPSKLSSNSNFNSNLPSSSSSLLSLSSNQYPQQYTLANHSQFTSSQLNFKSDINSHTTITAASNNNNSNISNKINSDEPCQKHGLQSCVLCTMFNSSGSSNFTSSSSISSHPSLSSNSNSILSSLPYKPISQLPSSHSFLSTSSLSNQNNQNNQNNFGNSSIICPIHSVTNCLLCNLNKPSSFSTNSFERSNPFSSLISSTNHSISGISSLPSASVSASSASISTPLASSSFIPSYSQGIYNSNNNSNNNNNNNSNNSNILSSNISSGGNDWERMLYSTGIKRDIPSFPQQQQQQQQQQQFSQSNFSFNSTLSSPYNSHSINQDLPNNSIQQLTLNSPFISNLSTSISSKIGNLPANSNFAIEPLMTNSLSTKPPINSLSSADSAFGFNSSNYNSSKNYSSTPNSIKSSTSIAMKQNSNSQNLNVFDNNEVRVKTPSQQYHQQYYHQQEQEQGQGQGQEKQEQLTSNHNSPSAIPSYLLKKGIIFEDENDDPGSTTSQSSKFVTDHRRNLKHQAFQSENNKIDEPYDNNDSESDNDNNNNHNSQSNIQRSHKKLNKKQSKDKNKLMKLSNGALVKKSK